MKGKPPWKPIGLKAKRWRVAGQLRGPANLLPFPKFPEKKTYGKAKGSRRQA